MRINFLLLLFFFLLTAISTVVHAGLPANTSFAPSCLHHFYQGVPPIPKANCTNTTCIELCHGAPDAPTEDRAWFATLQNGNWRAPEYAAQFLTYQQAWDGLGNSWPRPSWKLNDAVRADQQYPLSLPGIWDGTGPFDKGHLLSKASLDYSEEAADSSFSVCGVIPQSDSCNRGEWLNLVEKEYRYWVRGRNVSVYTIFAVGYKDYGAPTWLPERVVLPDYMVFAICDPSTVPSKSMAMVAMSREDDCGGILNLYRTVRSVEVEFLNGTRLFPGGDGCNSCSLDNDHWFGLGRRYRAGNSTPELCATSAAPTTTTTAATSSPPTTTATAAPSIIAFPANSSWQSIAWCPKDRTAGGGGSYTRCQNRSLVQPWQTVVAVDMFDTSAATISEIRSSDNNGHKVICYVNAGAWEDWRPDKNDFPAWVQGADYGGWPGEKWLLVLSENATVQSKLKEIFAARLQTAADKGCQGIDFDNMDCWANAECYNSPGNNRNGTLQIEWNSWLAAQCHARGMAAGLKNDLEQVQTLEPRFDFAVVESCQKWTECNYLTPFITANKAVFSVEYDTNRSKICGNAQQGFSVKYEAVNSAGGVANGLWADCQEVVTTTVAPVQTTSGATPTSVPVTSTSAAGESTSSSSLAPTTSAAATTSASPTSITAADSTTAASTTISDSTSSAPSTSEATSTVATTSDSSSTVASTAAPTTTAPTTASTTQSPPAPTTTTSTTTTTSIAATTAASTTAADFSAACASIDLASKSFVPGSSGISVSFSKLTAAVKADIAAKFSLSAPTDSSYSVRAKFGKDTASQIALSFCVPCADTSSCSEMISFFARSAGSSIAWLAKTKEYVDGLSSSSSSTLEIAFASATLQQGGTTQAATPAPPGNSSAAADGCDESWSPHKCRTSLIVVIAVPAVLFVLIMIVAWKRRSNNKRRVAAVRVANDAVDLESPRYSAAAGGGAPNSFQHSNSTAMNSFVPHSNNNNAQDVQLNDDEDVDVDNFLSSLEDEYSGEFNNL